MNPLFPFEFIAAVRFLREGRMQSILIVAGVAIGVAVIVFMSALLTGLQGNIIRRTLSAQAHIVILPPEEIARPLRSVPDAQVAAIVQKKAQRLRSIDQWQKLRDSLQTMPGILAVSPEASGPAFAVRGDASRSISVIGIEPEQYVKVVALNDKIVDGALRVSPSEAVIGTDLAKDLGVGVGDKFRVTTSIGRSETFIVGGIFDLGNKGVNQRNVYIPLHSAQSLLDLVGGVSSLDLTVKEIFKAEVLAQRINAETGLEADSWIKTNAQFFTALSAQTFTNTIIRVFVALSVAFGIASVLVVSVVQKSKEIGILRAMGTSRGQVMRLFLIQGGLVGLAGSCIGSGMASLFLMGWRQIAKNPDGTPLFNIEVDLKLLIGAMVLATLTGIISAVFPARRASKLDPVVAIRG
ncbi:lipoprotein-releasing system permease protein [Novimethylophilus kurashikiensis]|uniref:Lipoprotein-releasing system permease protein n=1 Tax=Novimethylophilus kurashikiensis TaxID=1825523 RepID=A0A2R5F1B3_9PROT|nr:ABC transporter permease [Novimethylophilus kurashikiensis]GBG12522.1 lipoprotein-releasing system permease protein [Novimethylophilus kurashikiensis]